ncbi:MAG: nucleoside-diphosphate kinase [Bacillota bacterium]|nr:nucleoside-diphosphate kinase [Bacillota bacterium]
MERTFIIVKPEAVRRGLVGRVLARLEGRGLRLVALEVRQLTRPLVEEHYAHLKEKPFFPGLVDSMVESPAVLGIVEGPDAIEVVRRLAGPTNPVEAPPGTIRGDWGLELPHNVIHASDSPASAQREIQLFFGPGPGAGR